MTAAMHAAWCPAPVLPLGRTSSIVRMVPQAHRRCIKVVNVMSPSRQETLTATRHTEHMERQQGSALITREAVQSLEAELDNGESVKSLRRFNRLLSNLPADSWEPRLRAVMGELAYNLESFNPAFTAVLLKVQSTIGHSDYVARDLALKNLIQPLAGEYGMHNGQEQAKTYRELFSEFCRDLLKELLEAKTHRELFSEFYRDLLKEPLEDVLAVNPRPLASMQLFQRMMHDIMTGGQTSDPIDQACYAMGYNLAIEYLADYEKTWMLDSFRSLNQRVLQAQNRPLTEWLFLKVHAEGEAEHAAIGHAAVAGFVLARKQEILRRAMMDHDRDFAVFYNTLADMLE